MRNILGVAGSFAAAALLIGCSATPPAPPMAAAPAATATAPGTDSASGGLDGVYRGPEGGTAGNSRCTRRLGSPIRVTGGVASLATAVNGTLEGKVGPDGSLMIQNGRALVSGQFANGTFNGTYSSNSCVYTLAYAKR